MKQNIIIYIGLALAVLITACNEKEDAIISFEKQYSRIGEIKKGDKLKCVFKFINKGRQDLLIRKVVASCGCTSFAFSKKSIPPNGTGKIIVLYDSSEDTKGEIVKSIVVESNSKLGLSMLYINGIII